MTCMHDTCLCCVHVCVHMTCTWLGLRCTQACVRAWTCMDMQGFAEGGAGGGAAPPRQATCTHVLRACVCVQTGALDFTYFQTALSSCCWANWLTFRVLCCIHISLESILSYICNNLITLKQTRSLQAIQRASFGVFCALRQNCVGT